MTETMTTAGRVDYYVAQGSWRTPRGRDAVFAYRLNTNDWNTLTASTTFDEYGLKDRYLSGLAVDIGGYLGSVGIAMALDNPDLRVVIVEAIGENVEMIRRNIDLNGVGDRVTVLHAAAAAPDIETVDVFWRARGTESFEHHAFVGNSTLVYSHGDTNHETETVACISLSALREGLGFPPYPPDFLKIDCEGCEWSALQDPWTRFLPLIVGEWHPVLGKTRDDLVDLLPDHDVTFSGPVEGPGGFVAVLR